jgi:hypothetical protein
MSEEVVDDEQRLAVLLRIRLRARHRVEAGLGRLLAVRLLEVEDENPERAEQVIVVGRRKRRGAGACGERVVVRRGRRRAEHVDVDALSDGVIGILVENRLSIEDTFIVVEGSGSTSGLLVITAGQRCCQVLLHQCHCIEQLADGSIWMIHRGRSGRHDTTENGFRTT